MSAIEYWVLLTVGFFLFLGVVVCFEDNDNKKDDNDDKKGGDK